MLMKVTQWTVQGPIWGLPHRVGYIHSGFHWILKVGAFSWAEPPLVCPFISLLCLKSPSLPAVSKHRCREHKLTSWITVRPTIQSWCRQSNKMCWQSKLLLKINAEIWEWNNRWNYLFVQNQESVDMVLKNKWCFTTWKQGSQIYPPHVLKNIKCHHASGHLCIIYIYLPYLPVYQTMNKKVIWVNILHLCLPSSRSSGNDCSSSIVLEAWIAPRWHRSTQHSGQPSPWWCSLSGRREGWAGTHLLVRRKKILNSTGEIISLWLGSCSDIVCL